MDFKEKQRRHNLRVIISEAIMVLTIAATVIILAFLVSGYWLNSDFEVERQGMLQISSVPTGADVTIDGITSSWLQRTNTSKMLSSGEHTIELSREGYDTWSKTINISEGLLYRVHYPRLFLNRREKESVYDTIGTTRVFLSDNHEEMLLYLGDPSTLDVSIYQEIPVGITSEELSAVLPDWSLLSLNSVEIEAKNVSLRTLYDFFKVPKKESHKNTVADMNIDLDLNGDEKLIFSEFYDDRYLTVLSNNQVNVYKKDVPEPVLSAELSFMPEEAVAGHKGEFNLFTAGSQIATLDMEALSINEWSVDGSTYGWFDRDMLYSIKDGVLFVYDFDGLNRRKIATNVSERFPVVVIDNRYLYYFSDDNLVREWLVAR